MIFPIHTLAFALWILVVDPHLVFSDDTSEKVVLFILIPVKKVLADIQAFGHVVIYELLGNPLCTDLMKTVCCGWFHGWNHDWLADDLPLHHQLPFSYSELWHGFVQCSLWMWIVAPSFCMLHLCYCFWTGRSIHTHFALVKHCSHIMLKVFDGFLPLVQLHLPRLDHCTFPCFRASSKWSSHINPAVAKWLFNVKITVWKGHSFFICHYILLQYWDLHTPTPPS